MVKGTAMAGYNRIILIGNLTRDPEHKQLASGQAVCRLSIASNRQFKNRQTGSMVQEVCYIDIDVWGAQADSCRQYLQKGRPVLVEGRLKYDTWDANGQTRGKHSVVADRVVFLSAGAPSTDEVETGDESGVSDMQGSRRSNVSVEPATGLERDLLDQIDKVKSRMAQKGKAKKVADENELSSGEMDFKDQAPFEDELPF